MSSIPREEPASDPTFSTRERIGATLALLGVFIVAFQASAFISSGAHASVALTPWNWIGDIRRHGTPYYWPYEQMLLVFLSPSILGFSARICLARSSVSAASSQYSAAGLNLFRRVSTALVLEPLILFALLLYPSVCGYH
jgi:hypothetical protein